MILTYTHKVTFNMVTNLDTDLSEQVFRTNDTYGWQCSPATYYQERKKNIFITPMVGCIFVHPGCYCS